MPTAGFSRKFQIDLIIVNLPDERQVPVEATPSRRWSLRTAARLRANPLSHLDRRDDLAKLGSYQVSVNLSTERKFRMRGYGSSNAHWCVGFSSVKMFAELNNFSFLFLFGFLLHFVSLANAWQMKGRNSTVADIAIAILVCFGLQLCRRPCFFVTYH